MSKLSVLLLIVFCSTRFCYAQDTRPWYDGEPRQHHEPNPKAKILPVIKVQGNMFVDPQGNSVLFRGIAISDPDKIERQGHWNKNSF